MGAPIGNGSDSGTGTPPIGTESSPGNGGAEQTPYHPPIREEVRYYLEKSADYAHNFMGLAFITGMVAAYIPLATALGVSMGSLAAAATPIGWATAGLFAISVGIFATRHLYMRYHDFPTDTFQHFMYMVIVPIQTTIQVATFIVMLFLDYENSKKLLTIFD